MTPSPATTAATRAAAARTASARAAAARTASARAAAARTASALALGLLGALAAPAARAQATLSLTPLAATTAAGSTVTFTINLTGGTNLASYNINVLINPAQLKFVGAGATLFTHADAALFPVTFTPQLSANGGDLNFAAGDFTPVNNVGPTPLGTFQVQVLAALPAAGSAVSFGPLGLGGAFAGTSVTDGTVNELTATAGATVFTPAPEPPQGAALALGALALAALALKARKRSEGAA